MKKREFLTSVTVIASNLLLSNSGFALSKDAEFEDLITKIEPKALNPFVLTNSDNSLLLVRGHRSHSSHRSHYSGSGVYNSHYSGSGGYYNPGNYVAPSSPSTYISPTTSAPGDSGITTESHSATNSNSNTYKNVDNSVLDSNTDASIISPEMENLNKISNRLKKIKDLKDVGILTEEEYELKRKELVDRIN